MMKLMIVGRRRGGMTVAQLHRYMLDVHGAMVVRAIGEHPHLTPQRYVQNHVFDGSTRVPGALTAAPDPFSASLDFVTQVWFNNPAQAKASVEAAFYKEHLQPDEDRFVDQPSVVKLPVVEQPVFGPRVARGRSKLFVFHQGAPGIAVDALAAQTAALWEPMLADAKLGIERLVRNRGLVRPGETAPADLVDEVWLADDASSRILAQHWQALLDDQRLPALHAPGSGFVLLAHEHVLFAGAMDGP
jgi:hypothetical protein